MSGCSLRDPGHAACGACPEQHRCQRRSSPSGLAHERTAASSLGSYSDGVVAIAPALSAATAFKRDMGHRCDLRPRSRFAVMSEIETAIGNRLHRSRISTLVDLLRFRATDQRHDLAFAFLEDGTTQTASMSYGELDQRASAIAAALKKVGHAGERCLLMYP